MSEHLDSASKTSPKWLNRRPKVLRKRPQRQFTAKGTLSCSLPLLKPRLSRDSLVVCGEEISGKLIVVALILAGCSAANSEKSSPAWGLWHQGSLDAVVNAITHIHIKPPWLPEESFVAGAAAAVAVAGGLSLGIRLRFNNHAPEQLTRSLAFHQQAADQLGGDDFGGAAEEGVGEVLGELGGYGCGLVRKY